MVVLEQVDDAGVGKGGRVAQVLLLVVWQRELAQNPAHDLARPRLGQSRGPVDFVWHGERADDLPDLLLELRLEIVDVFYALFQGHVAVYTLTLDVMRKAYDSCLGHLRVCHQGRFDLCCADTVPRDVDDVVDAPREPVEAVFVPLAAVAGEVVPVVLREIDLLEARVVAIHRPHHGGVWPLKHQTPAALALQLVALVVQDGRLHAEERERRRARLALHGPDQGRHEMTPGLRLPVGVGDRAAASADDVEVPLPGPRIDGLPHRAEEPEAREVMLLHGAIPGLHESPDGGGRRVEEGHLVLLAHIPEAVHLGIGWDALEDHLRGAIQQGPVCNVRVARDPPTVGRAEPDVLRVVVERVLHSCVRAHHVASGRVQDALGLPSAARGVEHEERILALHPLAGTLGRLRPDKISEPHVTPFCPAMLPLVANLRSSALQPVHAHDLGHCEAVLRRDLAGLVRDVLELHRLRPTHHSVCCDYHRRLRVADAASEGVSREAAEDDRVDSADPRTGQH
mmetsp:Transcript_73679/g.192269  ORF Transcript_73679/g.192269 Transcript_73679/m.192269 type:complete len:511 (-) Transcript_73679:576-2108(-)